MQELQELVDEVLTPGLGKRSVNQVPVAQVGGKELKDIGPDEALSLCREFFVLGNLSALARNRGVQYGALLEMAKQSWWKEEITSLEREANILLKVRLTKMLGKTLDELEDRLENGDEQWKDHGYRKIPVPARDLAVISNVISAQKQRVEAEISGESAGETKRLTELAAALRIVQQRPGDILDVDVIRDE